jgi:hypothetical protein
VRRRPAAALAAAPPEGTAMHHSSPEMQACIKACERCHAACLGTAMRHCIEKGGRHVEPEHLPLMMACAEICRTLAAFMPVGTDHHRHTCAACGGIRDGSARSGVKVGAMQACVEACRRCAEECRRMAG